MFKISVHYKYYHRRRKSYVNVSNELSKLQGEHVNSTIATFLTIFAIFVFSFAAIALAAYFNDDIRMTLFSKILNPLLIIAGKDYIIRDTREKEVYGIIREFPGVSYRRLLEELQMDNSILVYHLSRLQREKLISLKSDEGMVTCYTNYVTAKPSQTGNLPPMSPLEKHILETLRRLGPAARCEIENTLRLFQSPVKEALSKLKVRGLVNYDGEGKWDYCWAVNSPPKFK